MGVYLTNLDLDMLRGPAGAAAGVGAIGGALSLAQGFSSAIINVAQAIDFTTDVESLKPKVKDYVGEYTWLADSLKDIELGQVPSYIKTIVGQRYYSVIDLLRRGVGEGVGGLHAQLYEGLTGLGRLQTNFNDTIQRIGIDPYYQRWANTSFRPNWLNSETAWFLNRLGKLTDQQYKVSTASEGWRDNYLPLLADNWYQPVPISVLLELRRRNAITEEQYKYWLKYYRFSDIGLDQMVKYLDVMPEPYRAAELAARSIITPQQAKEAFAWYGFTGDWAKQWTEAQRTRPSLGMLAEMRWRKIIDDKEIEWQIKATGYPDGYEKNLLKTFDQIPPAQDIITMVVREAFEQANIVSAPKEFADWISQKGFSSYWADKYWTAHFTPIPLNLAYDNLRRGLHDEAWMGEVLRIADIHPRWRQDILNVAYRPPAIRELGYGFDVGNYTRDDIIKYRRWGGLSPDDAVKAADSLIDYRLEAERNTIRTANMNKFINGMIDEAVFRAELKRLRTNNAAIDLWVERAKLMIELKPTMTSYSEPPSLTRTDAQWLYEKGLRDLAWFTQTLKDIGYSDTSIKAYIDQSNKKIADNNKPVAVELPKTPSLAQINDFYENKLIDRATALSKIVAIGYIQTDAELMVQVWDKTIAIKTTPVPTTKATPRLTESELEKLYLYGYYTAEGLAAEYMNRGYSEVDAQLRTYIVTLGESLPILRAQYKNAWIGEQELATAIGGLIAPLNKIGNTGVIVDNIMMTLVKNTQVERLAPERDLTKAEILKGAKNQVLTLEQAISLLVDMGYSDAESQYLLAINGIVAINDPKGYWDMKQAVELGRRAMKMSYMEVPNELINAEEGVKQCKTSIEVLKKQPEKIGDLVAVQMKLAGLEGQINSLKSALRRK